MKILTTNFLTCAVKTCKTTPASYPLHFKDAQLERNDEIEFQPLFIRNILPRINWDALTTTANELGLGQLVPERNPVEVAEEQRDGDDMMGEDEQESEDKKVHIDEEVLRNLHVLLMETGVVEGKLVCANCGFEYPIKEGVGNFLLPPHLV